MAIIPSGNNNFFRDTASEVTPTRGGPGPMIPGRQTPELTPDVAATLEAEAARAVQNMGPAERTAFLNQQLQEQQLATITDLTRPFREAGLTGLSGLLGLTRGGELDYQPSQLFERQLERGREGIMRQQAGAGGVKSSRTFERLSDLASGLAAEDIGRFERGQLSLLQTGLGAERNLAQAGTALTGNIGSILSNLGQQQNIAGQQEAQAEISRGQTTRAGFSGLSSLLLELGQK